MYKDVPAWFDAWDIDPLDPTGCIPSSGRYGTLAAFCQQNGRSPQQVWENPAALGDFQAQLRKRGVWLEWSEEIL